MLRAAFPVSICEGRAARVPAAAAARRLRNLPRHSDRATGLLLNVICVVVCMAYIQVPEGGGILYDLSQVGASAVGEFGPVRLLELVFVDDTSNDEDLLADDLLRIQGSLDPATECLTWENNLAPSMSGNIFARRNWHTRL